MNLHLTKVPDAAPSTVQASDSEAQTRWDQKAGQKSGCLPWKAFLLSPLLILSSEFSFPLQLSGRGSGGGSWAGAGRLPT